MFFSSLHHSGLYSPSPLRALLGRAPAPSRSPPAARRGGWAAGPPTDTAGEYLPVGRSLFRISSGRSDMERERLDGDGGAVAAAQQWARAIDSGSPRRTAEVAERAEAAAEVEAAAAAAADFIDDNDPRGNMALRDEVLYCIRRGVSEACSVPYAELPIEGSDLHLELETAPMGGSQAHSLSLLSAQHGLAWWWRGDAPAERDGGARARAAESGKWAHAAGGPTGGLSSVRQDAIAQLSSSALSAASAAAPIPRGFRSQRFMLHSSLTTLQLLSLSWLLFARQVSGPAGAAAQWPPLLRALFSCSATQCVLEASRRDRAAAFAVADVGRRERDAAWPGFEHAGEVAAWLWDTARSERDAAAPRHGTGAPLEASPGTHTPTGLASGRSGAAGAVEQTAPDPPGASGSGDAGRNAADASWPPMASVGSDGISESVNTNRVGHSDRERGGPSDGSSVERKYISELALPLQLRAPLSLFGRRRRLSLLSPRVNATETHGGRRRMGRASRISLDDEDSAAFGEWAYLTMTGAPSGDAAWGEWAEQGHIGEGLVDAGEGSAGGVGVDAATGVLGASSPASAWGQHAWSRISEGGKALASATEAQASRTFTLSPFCQSAAAATRAALPLPPLTGTLSGAPCLDTHAQLPPRAQLFLPRRWKLKSVPSPRCSALRRSGKWLWKWRALPVVARAKHQSSNANRCGRPCPLEHAPCGRSLRSLAHHHPPPTLTPPGTGRRRAQRRVARPVRLDLGGKPIAAAPLAWVDAHLVSRVGRGRVGDFRGAAHVPRHQLRGGSAAGGRGVRSAGQLASGSSRRPRTQVSWW